MGDLKDLKTEQQACRAEEEIELNKNYAYSHLYDYNVSQFLVVINCPNH